MNCKLVSLLFITFIFLSCKKQNKEVEYYFKGVVNGKTVHFTTFNVNDNYLSSTYEHSYSGSSGHDIYDGTSIQKYSSSQGSIDENHISVSILKRFTTLPVIEDIRSMYKIGGYPFGIAKQSSMTVNGAVVEYFDENGNLWSSEYGNQNGSTFSIIEIADIKADTEEKMMKATFNCKVYNSGNSILISGAEIKGVIINKF